MERRVAKELVDFVKDAPPDVQIFCLKLARRNCCKACVLLMRQTDLFPYELIQLIARYVYTTRDNPCCVYWAEFLLDAQNEANLCAVLSVRGGMYDGATVRFSLRFTS
jgi:hypothetical protein